MSFEKCSDANLIPYFWVMALEKTRRFCRQVNKKISSCFWTASTCVQRSSLGWCSRLTYIIWKPWIGFTYLRLSRVFSCTSIYVRIVVWIQRIYPLWCLSCQTCPTDHRVKVYECHPLGRIPLGTAHCWLVGTCISFSWVLTPTAKSVAVIFIHLWNIILSNLTCSLLKE